MINTKLIKSLLILACCFMLSASWGRHVYVKSLLATFTKMPEYGAEKMRPIPRGTKLEVKETVGPWLRTEYREQEGWVHSLTVMDRPPKKRPSLLKRKKRYNYIKARRRASAFTSAAAARGITELDVALLEKLDSELDFESLEIVESFYVKPEQGKLLIESSN